MKKYAVLFLFFLTLLLNSEEKKNKEFFFYIPNQQQIEDYFNLFQYLMKWDKNGIIVNDEGFKKYYEEYVSQESIQGLLFEAFLRQTRNKKIKNQALKYINNNNKDDEFSLSLIRLYNSTKKKIKQDKIDQIQYNYQDEYFDENINMFYQTESYVFNKELGLMLFENPWTNMCFKSDNDKLKNRDSFFLMYGGGTNCLSINFDKYNSTNFEEYKSKVINQYNSERYKDWTIKELNKEGILENSGADKIFIGFDTGPDIFPEIDTATFNVYLYNEKSKIGYMISYFMNFSKINNNYNMRHRIWNHLLMQLTLSFINIQQQNQGL